MAAYRKTGESRLLICSTIKRQTYWSQATLLPEQDHDNFRNVMGDRSLVIEQLKLPEFQRVPFAASVREDHPRAYGRRTGYHSSGFRGHRRNEERRSYSGDRDSRSEDRGPRQRDSYSGGRGTSHEIGRAS